MRKPRYVWDLIAGTNETWNSLGWESITVVQPMACACFDGV